MTPDEIDIKDEDDGFCNVATTEAPSIMPTLAPSGLPSMSSSPSLSLTPSISGEYPHSKCADTEDECASSKKSKKKKKKKSATTGTYPVCFLKDDDKYKTECIAPDEAPKNDYEFVECGECS